MTTIYTQTLTINDSARLNASIRARVPVSAGVGSATQIRVTFQSSGAGAFSCDNVSIGINGGGAQMTDTTLTPTSLLFSGNPNFLIASGGNVLASDWLTIAGSAVAGFVDANNLVVVMDVSSANGTCMHQTGLADAQNGMALYTSSDTYNVADVGVGSEFSSRMHGVTMIEIQGSGGASKLIGGSLLYSPLLDGRLVR